MATETEVTAEGEIPPDNSTLYLGLGLGLGGYATASAILAGFVCPVCVVAAPTLIATGVYQKLKKRSRRPKNGNDVPEGQIQAH